MIQEAMVSLKSFVLRMLPATVAGQLRAWKNRKMIRNFAPKVVEHVFGSGTFKVYLADPLSKGWYDCDWEQLPEIEELKLSRLRSGARVFDIGAHQAVVALMLAREVGPTGLVVAVEASRHNAQVARKNVELNDVQQIEVVHCAVSDHNGRLWINEALNSRIDDGTGSWGRQDVEAMTLDSLSERFGMPDVVFLDVEGAECMALAGAKKVLDSDADFFIEVHVGCGLEDLGYNVQQLIEHFSADKYGLSVRTSTGSEFRPMKSDDEAFRERFFLLARPYARSDITPRL